MKRLVFGFLAAGCLAAFGGVEFRSDDIRLDKPLASGFLAFSDNIRRFDVKLAQPMDLSSAAGVTFEVKCADPALLTDCWLLFKTGDGYYRAGFPVPKRANEWTPCTVLKRDVRLYHWNTHVSLHEIFVKPDPALLPDWSRVTEYQVVFSLEIDRTTRDGAVAVRDFAALDPNTPACAAAIAASDAAEAKALADVARHPSRPGERRFLATHVWGLDWNWDETCRKLKEGGVTDVIPLMTYSGYAYYGETKIEVPSPLLAAHGDAFRLCLAACRKHGLKCHPWRSCWELSDHAPAAYMRQVREEGRLQVSFDGRVENWFCPTHPANVQREIDGFMELANLGANGIMLDYFRYPDENHCFCPRCRAQFEKALGHPVANWPADVRSDANLAKRWSSFRRDVLTDVLRTIRAELRRRAPELELSAAVAATPEGGEARGQDWPQWCREGLLDRLFPMCYNSTSKLLRRDLKTLTEIVGKTQTKLTPMTCFACGDIPFLPLEEVCRQIDTVRSFGLSDLAFFRLTEYAPYVLKALRSGPLKDGEVVLRPGAAEVVIERKAPSVVRFAAEEATNFLSQALGASVPLVHEPTSGRTSVILGENEWSRAAGLRTDDLARDAYRVKAEGDRVYILGRDDRSFDLHGFLARKTGYGILLHGHERATLFGIYGWMEKYAGVRFIFPDEELGTVVKRADAIRIPSGVETVTPDYLLRNPYFGGDGRWHVEECAGKGPKEILWLRHRYASMIIPCCHGSRQFKYIERFGKTHPEYLARKKDGSVRLNPKEFAPYQYCWSNPGLRETLYQDVKAYLTGQTAASRGLESWGVNCAYGKYVDIMPDDSFTGCFCADCQKAYTGTMKSPMDRSCAYANDLMWGVCKEIGDRLIDEGVPGGITMMSYFPYNRIPDFNLPTNVHVMVAKSGPWTLPNRAKTAEDMADIRAWAKKLGHKVWIWTYPSKFGELMIKGVPCVGPHAWGRYYGDLHDAIIGGFMECESDLSIYNFLNYYVFSHVMWDHTTDVDALLDEAYALLFGAGRDEMKRFFGILEENWTTRVVGAVKDTPLGPKTVRPDNKTLWTEIYSPACRAELDRLLAAAAAKVPAGSKDARRIALMRREFYDRMCAGAAEYESVMKDVDALRYDVTKGPLELKVLNANRTGHGDAKVRTSVSVEETSDALVFTFDCEEPDMDRVSAPYMKPGDPNNWKNNCVELRLNPSGDRTRIYYISISSANVPTCSFTATDSGLGSDWSQFEGLKSETRTTASGWRAKIVVPKAVLEDMKRAFPVEFCRYRVRTGEAGEAIQWSPYAHGFSDIERFGTMVLKR